jgi:hypothetical protein
VQSTAASTREAWVGPTAPVITASPVQVTADAHFVDTLDETGIMGFFTGGLLLLGVGERADPLNPLSQHIDGMDLYTATPQAAGGVALTNISLTSGDPAEPFTKGELSTEDGLFKLPGGAVLTFNDKDEELELQLPGTTGMQTLLTQVKSLDSVALAGDPASPATKVLLASLPTDAVVERHALRPDGVAAVVVRFLGKEWVAKIDLVAGTAKLALSSALVYGPALAFAPGGGLALTAGAPGNPAFPVLWPSLGPALLLPFPIAPGQLLPGAS